jgi:hypothetical protein
MRNVWLALMLFVGACGGDSGPATVAWGPENGHGPWSEVLLGATAPGTSQDSVFVLIPEGSREWSRRYEVEGGVVLGYPMQMAINSAAGGMIQTYWLHDAQAPYTGDPRSDLNPIVFVEGALVGWGWSYFDENAERLGLLLPVATETDSGGLPDGSSEAPEGVEAP